MTEKEIDLVQTSFGKVLPIADDAAAIFYDKLFTMDPSLKPLFKGDMKEQGKKLMMMIKTAVLGLSNLEAIVPAVQDLGKRHVNYGVEASHYATVGAALIATLREGLGSEFDPETESAWVKTYTLLSNTMQDAAYKTA